MRKLLISLLAIVTILTVVYTGSTLAAHEPTLEQFDALPLDQQLELIDQIRPQPIIIPVRYVSSGRAVPSPKTQLPPVQVETLIRTYFNEEDVDLALRIAWCESRYDASAYNPSGASGLFQVMPGWFTGEWSSYPAFDPFDPVANVGFSAWLFYNSGVQNWNPSRGCWG